MEPIIVDQVGLRLPGHPSASASLVLGRWGFDSEFSGPLPEAPQTLREECTRGWWYGIQLPLYTGTEDDSLQGLEKKPFCELKTTIYPVSGVFCEVFFSDAWRKSLSPVFCLVQGRECTPQFQPSLMARAAAGKDSAKLMSDRAGRHLSDQETRPGEEAWTSACQEAKWQL